MASEVLSVPEAAKRLHLSRERVQALIRDGLLEADMVGHRWLIPAREVERRARVAQLRGRPIQASSAWAATKSSKLPRSEGDRDRFRRRLRPRAEEFAGYAHPSMLDRLRHDRAVVISGREAAEHYDVPAGADPAHLDAYIRRSRFEQLCEQHIINGDAANSNVRLHVVDDDVWPFEPAERHVPLLVAWLDLADIDDRAESLARQALLRRHSEQP